jgi:hypothetical protein
MRSPLALAVSPPGASNRPFRCALCCALFLRTIIGEHLRDELTFRSNIRFYVLFGLCEHRDRPAPDASPLSPDVPS